MSADLVVGRYRRERLLGSGAMSDVWLAEDTLLRRWVAIKRLRVDTASALDDASTQRLMREARLAARLHHPHSVGLFDLVDDGGTPYLVMEYVDGESLAYRIRHTGALSVAETARIGAEVASALTNAHDAGIVHRDIKPANVLLDNSGGAKLADFGISRGVGDAVLTDTGQMMGTVAFMAPETAKTGRADAASDVWSLGATLFCAIEAKPPFDDGTGSQTPANLLLRLVTEPPPIAPHAGPIAQLLHRMMALEPELRPSADAVRAELVPYFTDTLGDQPDVAGGTRQPIEPAASGSRPRPRAGSPMHQVVDSETPADDVAREPSSSASRPAMSEDPWIDSGDDLLATKIRRGAVPGQSRTDEARVTPTVGDEAGLSDTTIHTRNRPAGDPPDPPDRPEAEPENVPVDPQPQRRRSRRAVIVIAAVLVLACGAVGAVVLARRGSDKPVAVGTSTFRTEAATPVFSGSVPAHSSTHLSFERRIQKSAGAVLLSVSARSSASDSGAVYVYEDGARRPVGASVLYAGSAASTNLVAVAVTARGLTVFNDSVSAATVSATLAGSWSGASTDGGGFRAITPTSVLDTSTGLGAARAPITQPTSLSLNVLGRGGVPRQNVAAVLVNVTARSTSATGWGGTYPTGLTPPGATDTAFPTAFDFAPGHARASLAAVSVGAGGTISVFNQYAPNKSGPLDLQIQVTGYFLAGGSAGAGAFVGLRPTRILNTLTTFNATVRFIPAKQSVTLALTGHFGVPAAATSVVIAVHLGGAADGSMQIAGHGGPVTAAVPFGPGAKYGSTVVTQIGADGAITFTNDSAGTVALIVDLQGYFTSTRG